MPPSPTPPQYAITASGRVACTPTLARVLAEELIAFTSGAPPIPRQSPRRGERPHEPEPVVLVLDRLEHRMSFQDSHTWMLDPNAQLDGERPAEAIAAGRVEQVLAVIETLGDPPVA